jgi:hypothetical protein
MVERQWIPKLIVVTSVFGSDDDLVSYTFPYILLSSLEGLKGIAMRKKCLLLRIKNLITSLFSFRGVKYSFRNGEVKH